MVIIVGVVIVLLIGYLVAKANNAYHDTRYYAALKIDGTLVRLLKDIDLRRTYRAETWYSVEQSSKAQADYLQNPGRIIKAGEISTVGDNGFYFDGDWIERWTATVEVESVPKKAKKKNGGGE